MLAEVLWGIIYMLIYKEIDLYKVNLIDLNGLFECLYSYIQNLQLLLPCFGASSITTC